MTCASSTMVAVNLYRVMQFRPPGTVVQEGLIFRLQQMFYFFVSPHDLRAPSADRRELCHMIDVYADAE